MRAAAIDAFGPAEALTVRDLPLPSAGTGEVLVRVRTAGVQPTDAAIRAGWTPPGATIGFPQILGNEFAGIVAEVGPGAVGFAVGDEVAGYRVLGCYAEYVNVPAEQVVHKPAGVSWLTAGALSASGQTAHTALERLGAVEGETLLVHGAAGGVGSMAVQLAVARGVRVVGTTAPVNHEYVRSLGAVPVEYGSGQLRRIRAAAPQGVDAALDTAGHGNLRTAVELVEDRNRIGTVVDIGLTRELGCLWINSNRSAARLRELLDLCDRGELAVTIRATHPLDEAYKAHLDVETGHGRGKNALVISTDDDAVTGVPPAGGRTP
ncbi:NADP-dependent oxidoreductase [Nocardiopsis ganjiahuensis]|uniref:NADP-dependent oxidoreductase n=1 Tax=Nocardiopsis ganjiahuensis TaxID=239984 RepID=UPI00034882BD|nr:NADP-dependent oxidoreductase [Nocardiopsis ganjiahuensis]